MAHRSNYEIKRTPDVDLRSNHHWRRAPLISALDIMLNLFARIRAWWNSPPPPSPVFPDGANLARLEAFNPERKEYGVQILNDDSTPMLVVVDILQETRGLSREDATRLMVKIHLQGGVLLQCQSREDASSLAERMNMLAYTRPGILRIKAVCLSSDV